MSRRKTDDDDDWLMDALEEADEVPPTQMLLPFDQPRPLPLFRPQTRNECADVPRPCPFVSCRYHLYLDVREDGTIRLNFPHLEPDEMIASCALDMASDGPRTLDLVGGLMGFSKERARQLEASGLQKIRGLFLDSGIETEEEAEVLF